MQRFGEVATLRRTTVADGSPSDRNAGTASTSDYAVRLAVFPVDQKDIDETVIKAGDFRVIVSAKDLAITPATTDELVCSAGTLAIIDAGRVAPAGTVTHYRMAARK